jgi:hypothetical protein
MISRACDAFDAGLDFDSGKAVFHTEKNTD